MSTLATITDIAVVVLQMLLVYVFFQMWTLLRSINHHSERNGALLKRNGEILNLIVTHSNEISQKTKQIAEDQRTWLEWQADVDEQEHPIKG